MIERDYKKAWVSPEGAEYRRAVYERQRAGGTRPLVDNPTVEEIRDALAIHEPQSVLEVGCGWGRLLKPLLEWFAVFGCDVSWEMMAEAPESLRTRIFPLDIATSGSPYNLYKFDVLFCRGVMMFIPPDKMERAMCNMEAMARKKVLVWEWTDVCRLMQATYKSEKFEYFPIQVKDE